MFLYGFIAKVIEKNWILKANEEMTKRNNHKKFISSIEEHLRGRRHDSCSTSSHTRALYSSTGRNASRCTPQGIQPTHGLSSEGYAAQAVTGDSSRIAGGITSTNSERTGIGRHEQSREEDSKQKSNECVHILRSTVR